MEQELKVEQKKPREIKVAIVHYWLMSMRGGEKVLEQLCIAYPQADIFTLVCRPDRISSTIKQHKITTSFIQRIPGGVSFYQSLLPLMPLAVEQFDLTGYDLILSQETNVSKGPVTTYKSLHINYCHTPMRYAWDMYHQYLNESRLGFFKKIVMAITMNYIRIWDVTASNRVDLFIASSRNAQARMWKHYRRDAAVIYPPVDVSGFRPGGEVGDFYLMLGQIIPYKRVDLAVEAFNRSGKKLVIVGVGSESEKLRAIAKENISFLGSQPFEVIRELYRTCKAFIFPGEEDIGITPLEAQASGRPVLAFARGGALETVLDGQTGLFFLEQTHEALQDVILRFENGAHSITPEKCVTNAMTFSNESFREQFVDFTQKALECHQKRLQELPGKGRAGFHPSLFSDTY
jgi:glycosyltransferase involved in cell wall biosynthesis